MNFRKPTQSSCSLEAAIWPWEQIWVFGSNVKRSHEGEYSNAQNHLCSKEVENLHIFLSDLIALQNEESSSCKKSRFSSVSPFFVKQRMRSKQTRSDWSSSFHIKWETSRHPSSMQSAFFVRESCMKLSVFTKIATPACIEHTLVFRSIAQV